MDTEGPPCSADPEMWFTEIPWIAAEAKQLCKECGLREKCLSDGRLEPLGIWGGLDPTERKRYRKRLQRVAYARARKVRTIVEVALWACWCGGLSGP